MKDLRKLRLAKGLSQQALAEKTGITQAAISYIEAGQHDPKYSTILRIAVCLGCEVDELVGSPNGGPTAPPVGASTGAADAA
jgi:transcriptional regulator with XRE-family HTH domain